MDAHSPHAVSVRIVGLDKHYGGIEALRGLSLNVAPGEIFGMLGPNGAGKTTALECLLGLRTPDSGSIEIGGIDALRHPRQVRAFVGAQLQDAALQDKITPREALSLFASFYPQPESVPVLLRRFGLSEKAGARFASLSGGLRRRLFLALAFVNRPRLVVLDEPTAGLDPRGRRELHELIRSLRSDGCTVLLSTHDLAEAESLCDRITILHAGRAVADDTPSGLIRRCESEGRIRFSAAPLPSADSCASLTGVSEVRVQTGADGVLLRSSDLHGTVAALLPLLEGSGARLTGLSVERASLEDVFLALTGQTWPGDEPASGRKGEDA